MRIDVHASSNKEPAMTDDLKKYDALSHVEQRAWAGWFHGGRNLVTKFSDSDHVSFGKAECEWVDFDTFWLGKVLDYGWATVEIDGPHEAKGGRPGVTYIKYVFDVTDKGWDVRDAHLDRFRIRAKEKSPTPSKEPDQV